MAKTRAIVKKEQAEVMKNIESMGDMGFEGADVDAYAVPFLRVLQTNSPQVNEDEESYIKGAKPGMFFNTIARKHYGKKIQIIPVYYQRDFVEWLPDRGGFIRSHGPNPQILDRVTERNERNQDILDNGNIIQDTKNHYVLVANNLEEGPVIFSLTSTGIKHSRTWMSRMRELKTPGGKPAAMFTSVYEVTTVINENDDGKWYQIGDKHMTAIKRIGWVSKKQMEAAEEAYSLIASGKTRADYDSLDSDKEADEPF